MNGGGRISFLSIIKSCLCAKISLGRIFSHTFIEYFSKRVQICIDISELINNRQGRKLTSYTFPTAAPYGKIVLTCKKLLVLWTISIAKVGSVDVPVVQTQTLFGEAQGPRTTSGQTREPKIKNIVCFIGRQSDSLCVVVKSYLSQDERVRVRRNDDVQRFSQLLGRVLREQFNDISVPILLDQRHTSSIRPPLIRGSYHPGLGLRCGFVVLTLWKGTCSLGSFKGTHDTFITKKMPIKIDSMSLSMSS